MAEGTMRRICVFCGSNPGRRPEYAGAAREMGRVLVERGLGLVYGGGNVGLMGIVADTVLAGGGEAIGVIPEALMAREVGHAGLTELHVVRTMHERKAMMADLSDAFVALPGGFGTFEEFCEVLTWSQLGFHPKPCGLLNVAGYYDPLLALFDRGVEEGFIPAKHRGLVIEETDPARLLDACARFQPPSASKWIGRDER
ncbi:TIGR00730 family Rossman fold protein [Longimicrobium sp.]|uniref:LOG family protein n=1 Tax=Longimicrobium sp. TaxID=2029185 RepID=UPI002CF087CA|nr:TIGR00730 family Rossman fold protein [Longimicrobium sp.]HSU17741.1 TIGR00730 family Rossman fold protein [Longimicrobium sp.]